MASKLSATGANRQGGASGTSSRQGNAAPPARVSLRPAAASAAFLLAAASSAAAATDGIGPWVKSGHSAARLLVLGPPLAGGARQAAVELRLDPGYLTYWRQPGEAGLPPTFDTGGSDNVAAVTVDYPAPGRFEEGGVPLFGYRTAVTFPLTVSLKDAGAPATLAVDLDYAVCAAICLPGRAAMRLALPSRNDPAAAAIVAAGRAAVPRPAALGEPGAVGIDAVTAGKGASPGQLTVTARAGRAATLFVEGPEGWAFTAGDPLARDDAVVFPVAIEARPPDAPAGPLDLRLTLVDAAGSIEVPARMDAGALTP